MGSFASAWGVSKMTVYRYFNSKERLFAGVVRDMCDRALAPELEGTMERLPLPEALRPLGRGPGGADGAAAAGRGAAHFRAPHARDRLRARDARPPSHRRRRKPALS